MMKIMRKGVVLTLALLTLGAAGIIWLSQPSQAQKKESGRRMLKQNTTGLDEKQNREIFGDITAPNRNNFTVDISENGTRFVFDDTPLHPDGSPAYGNEFITQGYIYPGGTLDGSNGTNPDGSPEFPNLVIGRWTCRGVHIGDGAHTLTGPFVITHQLFDFDATFGATTLANDGYELVDFNVPVNRAITGGTGAYYKARGEATQVLLGFPNVSFGVNLRVRLNIAP